MGAKSAGYGSLDHLSPSRSVRAGGAIDVHIPVATIGRNTYTFVIGRVTKEVNGALRVVIKGDGFGDTQYPIPDNIERMWFVSVRPDGSIDYHSESHPPVPADQAIELIKNRIVEKRRSRST